VCQGLRMLQESAKREPPPHGVGLPPASGNSRSAKSDGGLVESGDGQGLQFPEGLDFVPHLFDLAG
jgi:hypothetical protein